MTNSAKQFIEEAAPEYWYCYAHELADTADEIYRKSKNQWIAYIQTHADGHKDTCRRPVVSPPVLLMYGLSFENLIKGLLISEKPMLLQGGKLSKHLIGHEFLKLVDRLNTVQLDAVERASLVGTAYRVQCSEYDSRRAWAWVIGPASQRCHDEGSDRTNGRMWCVRCPAWPMSGGPIDEKRVSA